MRGSTSRLKEYTVEESLKIFREAGFTIWRWPGGTWYCARLMSCYKALLPVPKSWACPWALSTPRVRTASSPLELQGGVMKGELIDAAEKGIRE